MFLHGCRIGFFRGDVKLLVEDMQELKPTIFAAVPRLLNRIYDKVRILRVPGFNALSNITINSPKTSNKDKIVI